MVNFVVLLRRAMLVGCQMTDKKPDRPVIGRGKVAVPQGCPVYCQWGWVVMVNKGL